MNRDEMEIIIEKQFDSDNAQMIFHILLQSVPTITLETILKIIPQNNKNWN